LPLSSPQRKTSCVSSKRRRNSGIAGGIAKVGSSVPSPPPSAISSASRSPIGRNRGSKSGAPAPPSSPDSRRKLSRNARAARRVGNRTVMRARHSGSPAALSSRLRASTPRNGRSGAIV